MTNERICANDTGLPALMRHIDNMQQTACRLDELLQMAAYIDNEGQCKGGITVLLDVMADMSAELNSGLDSLSLPKVTL